MKSGIFILLTILTLFWSSCSNEIPVGEGEGQEVTLSVSLTAEELKTKSFAEGEKTINEKLLLVFNKENVCTGYSLNVDTVKTKSGEVKIVGIANPDEDLVTSLNEGKGLSYTQVFGKVTRQQLSDPTNLIKVGVITASLVTNTKPVLKVEVGHLPARVDLIIKLDGKEGDAFVFKDYSVTGINVASNLMLEPKDEVANTQKEYTGKITALLTGDTNATGNVLSFYTYERATTATDNISITVGGILKRDGKEGETKRYNITLNPVKNNAESRTDGIVHGYVYELTGTINAKNGIDVTIKVLKWDIVEVKDVEFGGGNSNNNDKK